MIYQKLIMDVAESTFWTRVYNSYRWSVQVGITDIKKCIHKSIFWAAVLVTVFPTDLVYSLQIVFQYRLRSELIHTHPI